MSSFTVRDKDVSSRLDRYLVTKLPDYSRAYLQSLIKDKVLVNKKTSRASYKLKLDDKVVIDLDESKRGHVEKIDIPIIYQDKDCLVINKPLGILSHAKGKFSSEGTVESFISDKVSGFEGDRAGIVHRLDRGTSGVMICAKNPETYKWLQKQFSSRKVIKTYVAIVSGHLNEDEAIIDLPIERNPKSPASFRVNSNGKSALTAYKVIKLSSHYSMISLLPKTGRTHQLRVHLSYLGHPIIGDTLYKGRLADRMYLHAQSIEIKLPDDEIHKFEVKIPKEFSKLMDRDSE